MLRKFLVPLDGSELGESALPLVEELATSGGQEATAEVVLLQVITPLNHWAPQGASPILYLVYTSEEIQQIQDHCRRYLEHVAERFKSKGVAVTTQISAGNAAEQIINAAKECNACLIAMSTHGRSGVSRWALGSVTDKVVRNGSVPVLVVKAQEGVAKSGEQYSV